MRGPLRPGSGSAETRRREPPTHCARTPDQQVDQRRSDERRIGSPEASARMAAQPAVRPAPIADAHHPTAPATRAVHSLGNGVRQRAAAGARADAASEAAHLPRR